jgi:all-trans-8'-apo-beta-carotenal 15,15'-oxygenase
MIDLAPGLERLFDFLPEEGDYEIAPAGELPAGLAGSYYLNGPCRFQNGELRYRHWLDGDGMVSALHFGDGGVRFVNRFVRGKKWSDEAAAGRPLYRAFGTSFPGDQLKRGIGLESPLNVSVYFWDGKLLAFGEQGLPWELDPVTLESRGEYTFGGRLNAISPMSAHAHVDPETSELFNFGISFSARQPSLTVYRIAPGDEIVYRRRIPLEWPASVHDFMLGERHLVFYVSPYLLEVDKLIASGATLMDALSWQPERGSRLVVLDRSTGEHLFTVPIEGRYCLHLINSFEEDGQLVVDVVELERPVYDQYQVLPDLFDDAPLGGPRRYLIDLEKKILAGAAESIAYRSAPDFPAIDPRRLHKSYDDLWLLGMSRAGEPGRKFFDQVVHLRWSEPESADLWQAPAGSYLGGEPVFLLDQQNESGGWVICQIFDAEKRESAFLLFDAFEVARGPVARLPLQHPLPACFHASFHPVA